MLRATSFGAIRLPERSVLTLSLCWAHLLTASTLITAAAPLSAKSIGETSALSPFSVGSFLFGAAVISAPSHRLFESVGRGAGFAVGCVLGMVGGALGVLALECRIRWMVFVSCFLIGTSQGMGQFYRFAATELCDVVEERARAVTLVLAGGIVAAFAGPQLATHSRAAFRTEYSGCYAVVVAINVLNLALIATVSFKDVRVKFSSVAPKSRTLAEIFRQPECVCAVCVASLAHTSMVCLMSPLTIAMDDRNFSFELTSLALQLHFFSMYAPGLAGTSWIIKTHGPYVASVVGLLFFAGSAVTLASGDRLAQFVSGMSLCGVAWNLSFSAGTVLLTTCHTKVEALSVQAINDFVIFGVAGIGSFASGYAYDALGWNRLVYCVSSLMAAFAVALAASSFCMRKERRRRFLLSIVEDDSSESASAHPSVDAFNTTNPDRLSATSTIQAPLLPQSDQEIARECTEDP